MSLSLRQLRAFLTVAEELNFVRASKRLNVAPPALSRTIREVEEVLGVQLFVRTTRSVELTRAGGVLAAETRVALAHLERAERLTQSIGSDLAGYIDIGYMDFAVHGPMMTAISTFLNRHADVMVHLTRCRSDEQSARVTNGEIDIGFSVRHRFNPALEVKVLSREPLVAVIPKSHRLSARDRISVADLVDETFILGGRLRWELFLVEIEAFCGRAGFVPRARIEASEGQTIFQLVSLGMGVTIYPACVERAKPAGCLIRRFVEEAPEIETFMIHRRTPRNPTVQKFIDLVSEVSGPLKDR